MQGYKTWIGLVLTLLGFTGAYKYVTQDQIARLKVFEDNITAHGLMYGRYNSKYGYPMDISIKYLNKRCVYSKKKDAKMELEKIIT